MIADVRARRDYTFPPFIPKRRVSALVLQFPLHSAFFKWRTDSADSPPKTADLLTRRIPAENNPPTCRRERRYMDGRRAAQDGAGRAQGPEWGNGAGRMDCAAHSGGDGR